MCCLDTIIQIGDQCHSDPVLARVQAMGLPAEKSAWQHGKVFFSVQPASEFGITDGGLWPKVKPRVWLSDRQVSMQRFEHMTEFFTVSLPVNSDVTLVTPGRIFLTGCGTKCSYESSGHPFVSRLAADRWASRYRPGISLNSTRRWQ